MTPHLVLAVVLALAGARHGHAAAHAAAHPAAHAAPAAAPAAAAAPAHAPLAIDDVEIRGERLVPQAVYIVGGPETDTEAAATVSDYLATLAPATDRVPAALVLVPEKR